jgi:hypothetical protein
MRKNIQKLFPEYFSEFLFMKSAYELKLHEIPREVRQNQKNTVSSEIIRQDCLLDSSTSFDDFILCVSK